jgi:predicted transcriptional regulator
MTFEVDQQSNNNGDRRQNHDQSIASGDQGQAISQSSIQMALRARQAALDVVLDNVSLIRAQSRLMGLVDSKDWTQAFELTKQEVERLRAELTVGATFEDLVYAAEDSGEDIQSLSNRLGVNVEQIADVLDNRNNTVKI